MAATSSNLQRRNVRFYTGNGLIFMSGIDQVSWRKFEKFLLKIGCIFKRQKGDHRIYWKPGIPRPVVVPQERVLPVFIILNNLRVLGVTKEDFLKIIEGL